MTQENYQEQKVLLNDYGCDEVFCETAKANLSADRTVYENVLQKLKAGDVLIVSSLDRIGASIGQLIELVLRLDGIGVGFVSIRENINTTTSYGKSFVKDCSLIQEMEHKLQKERSQMVQVFRRNTLRLGRVGMGANAKKKAKIAAKLYKDPRRTINEICSQLLITRATFYKYLRYEGVVVGGRSNLVDVFKIM